VTETVTVAVEQNRQLRRARHSIQGIRFAGPSLTKCTDAGEDYSAPKGSNWIGAAALRLFLRDLE
jgi:hypothetical protein